MARRPSRRPFRSFLAGGVLGGALVLIAPRARRRRPEAVPAGLGAFVTAPCFDLPPEAAVPVERAVDLRSDDPAADEAPPPSRRRVRGAGWRRNGGAG